MPFPNAHERREALLCLIYLRGGPGNEMRSSDTYRPLAEFFGLTETEQSKPIHDRQTNRTDRRHWDNLIQNSRKDLVKVDPPLIDDSSATAIWRLTGTGVREARQLFEGNPNFSRLRLLVNVEDQDRSDDELDQHIRTNSLRIGMVPTDTREAQVRQRKGQGRIHKLVVENYDGRCAVCDITDPRLLSASHIVGWRDAPVHRGDLRNVICLCQIHHALFDTGYWSLGDGLELVKRSAVPSHTIRQLLETMSSFRRPLDYPPAQEFAREHRKRNGFLVQQ